jgi:hypothetical protein
VRLPWRRKIAPVYITLYSQGVPITEPKRLHSPGTVTFTTPNGDLVIESALVTGGCIVEHEMHLDTGTKPPAEV